MKFSSMQDLMGRLGRTVSRVGIRVCFVGKHAFTDGKVIYLPAMDPSRIYNEEELLAVEGFVDHETAHIRWSDMNLTMSDKDRKKVWTLFNLIEDVRVERRMIEEYPGTRITLDALYDTLTPEITRISAVQGFGASPNSLVGLMSDYAMRNYREKSLKMVVQLEDFPQYAGIREILDGIPLLESSEDAVSMAWKLFGELKRLFMKSQGCGEDSGICDEGGSAHDGKGSSQKVSGKSNEKGAGEKPKEEPPKEEPPKEEPPKEEPPKKEESKEPPKKEESKEPPRKEESKKEESKEEESKEEESKEEESDSLSQQQESLKDSLEVEENSSKNSSKNSPSDSVLAGVLEKGLGRSNGKILIGEDTELGDLGSSLIDDLMKEGVRKLVSTTMGLGPTKDYKEGIYPTFDSERDNWDNVQKEGSTERYHEILDSISLSTRSAIRKMVLAFQSREKRSWVRGMEEGELDELALHKIKAGDYSRIYKQPSSVTGINTAVLVLLDFSTSMDSTALKETAVFLNEVMSKVSRLKYSFYGFSTESMDWGRFSKASVLLPSGERVKDSMANYGRLQPVIFTRVKGFDEDSNITIRKRIAAIRLQASTPIGDAYVRGVQLLMNRREERRILILSTDGYPSYEVGNRKHSDEMLQTKAFDYANRAGIEVWGVGIGAASYDLTPVSHYCVQIGSSPDSQALGFGALVETFVKAGLRGIKK